jgi:hypothetical protein
MIGLQSFPLGNWGKEGLSHFYRRLSSSFDEFSGNLTAGGQSVLHSVLDVIGQRPDRENVLID